MAEKKKRVFRKVSDEEYAAAMANAAPQGDGSEVAAGSESGPMGFLNKSLIDTLASPLDLLTYPIRGPARALGYEMTAPSTDIGSILNYLLPGQAVANEGEIPSTMGERIGSGVGMATGMLIPGGLAVNAATKAGGPVVKGIANMIKKPFIDAPKRALAIEATAGGTAGAGGELAARSAEGTGYEDAARMTGELAGGLTGVAVPNALGAAGRATASGLMNLAERLPLAGSVIKGGKELYQGLANPAKSSQRQAAAAVRNVVADPEAAAAQLEADTITGLPPMLAAREPGLMQMNQALMEANPELRALYAQQQAGATGEAKSSIIDLARGGAAQDTRVFLEDTIRSQESMLDDMLARARTNAEKEIAASGPIMSRTPVENSTVFRTELDKAYQAASVEESRLWSQVPKQITASVDNAVAAYRAQVSRFGKEGADLIPARARQFLSKKSKDFYGNAKNTPAVGNLQTLRSILLSEARAARAAGNDQAGSAAENIAKGLLEDMNLVPAAAAPLKAAREFTKSLSQRFEQGTIGAILKTGKGGTPAVAPGQSLSRIMSPAGEKLSTTLDEATAAVGDSPVAMGALDEYARGQFTGSLLSPEGALKLPTAANWVGQRSDFMQKFPALADVFDRALGAARLRAAAETDIGAQRKMLTDSPESRFLTSKVAKEFDSVLASQDPSTEMSGLLAAASQDSTGAATNGLRSSAVDYLLQRASTQISTGEIVQGTKILNVLDDPRTLSAMEQLFDPDEISGLRVLAGELKVWQQGAEATATKPVIGTLFEKMLNIGSGVLGAKAGRAISSGKNIQTPGIIAGMARRVTDKLTSAGANKLLVDAAKDKNLLASLLVDNFDNSAAIKAADSTLAIWMTNNAALISDEVVDPIDAFLKAMQIPEDQDNRPR